MSYKVKDHVYENRWETMPDGYIVKFEKQLALVPDQYVTHFRRISDFHVQSYIADLLEEPVELKEASIEPKSEQPLEDEKKIEKVEKEEKNDQTFTKVEKKKEDK